MTLQDHVKGLVEANYCIGEVVSVECIVVGDTNKCFCITCEANGAKEKYFCRQYHLERSLADLMYEQNLILHIGKKAPDAASAIITTKDNKTYVQSKYNNIANYYSLSTFLSGTEPYTWIYNSMSDRAFESMWAFIAQFHVWSHDYIPPAGTQREGSDMVSRLSTWSQKLPTLIDGMKDDPQTRFFYEHIVKIQGYVITNCSYVLNEVKKYLPVLPRTVIHADLHAGNLKFVDDEACAIFDFDWSCQDVRAIDVAWPVRSMLTSWDCEDFGAINLARLKKAIQIYNKEIADAHCALGALTKEECEVYPTLLRYCALRLIWEVIKQIFENRGRNQFECYLFVYKAINILKFIDENHDKIVELITVT